MISNKTLKIEKEKRKKNELSPPPPTLSIELKKETSGGI
jgi:hypothetical protein